jgi:IMP dehydrogenase/GMP reductase
MEKMLGYDDITLVPQFSELKGRGDCDTSIEINGDKYDLPLAIAPMITITTPEMIYCCWKNNIMTTLHRYFECAKDQYDYIYLGLGDVIARNDDITRQLYNYHSNNVVDFPMFKSQIMEIINTIYFAVGGIKKYKSWIDFLIEKGIKRFCVDFAHGDNQECICTCKYIKSIDPNIKIIAGNYVTYDAVKRNEYVDIYRMGISCGSCCTTARNTGFGMPTLSSVRDCQNRNDEIIMADGGVKVNGDIVKAMAFGADIVMIGYLLAGTSCAGGTSLDHNYHICNCNDANYNPYYKEYSGMASKRAKSTINLKGSIEGVSGLVKYTGFTQEVIDNIKENLKSALAYCGAKNWKDFYHKVCYCEITNNAFLEGKSRLQDER